MWPEDVSAHRTGGDAGTAGRSPQERPKGIISRVLARRDRVSATAALEGLLELPASMNTILRRFSSGAFTFDIADADMHRFQVIVDRATHRILVGLITAVLVIGSSLVIFASRTTITGPLLFLAYLGYAAAVIIGFVALYHSLA